MQYRHTLTAPPLSPIFISSEMYWTMQQRRRIIHHNTSLRTLTLAPPYDKLSDSLENIDTPVLESLTLHKASFDCFLGMSNMASLLRRAYGSSNYPALQSLTLRSVDFSGPELSDVIKHLPTITHVW